MSMKEKLHKKAHVVAWAWDDGDGFNWYDDEGLARKTFEAEKKLCCAQRRSGRHAVYFVFKRTRQGLARPAMTRAIGSFLNTYPADFAGIAGEVFAPKRDTEPRRNPRAC